MSPFGYLNIIVHKSRAITVAAIPVVKVGWLNPATSTGFESVGTSNSFGPVTTTLIASFLT